MMGRHRAKASTVDFNMVISIGSDETFSTISATKAFALIAEVIAVVYVLVADRQVADTHIILPFKVQSFFMVHLVSNLWCNLVLSTCAY